jgi:hypothetical protein
MAVKKTRTAAASVATAENRMSKTCWGVPDHRTATPTDLPAAAAWGGIWHATFNSDRIREGLTSMSPRCVLPLSAAVVLVAAALPSPAAEPPRVLDGGLHHLRIEGPREWEEFPERPEAASLALTFDAEPNAAAEQTLRLRQYDVKQDWRVLLNGKELGRLRQDENEMTVYFAVPAGALAAGRNELRIEQSVGARPVPDDVRLGEVALDPRPVGEVLVEATVSVTVVDADTGEAIPARVTVLTREGVLQTVGAESGGPLAVRPGVVYTANGMATFGLPAGSYVLHAGRGFEYSLASEEVTLATGDRVEKKLVIRREVPTAGWIACDTHTHSLTRSGHGDATAEERMVTLAGEGVELAIATDHDVAVDYEPVARAVGVRKFFTPVVGDEVTTGIGHFNVFPLDPNGPLPDPKVADWKALFESIRRLPGPKAVILNHPRDLHRGYRPFGPERFNAAVAEPLDGRPLGFDAVEVINSGATQVDPMLPVRDWMALLNVKPAVTPVGASDSHDVARYVVGQGRTYIRADDTEPGDIDVAEAVKSFLAGRVAVSYGLFAELTVDGRHGSGDVAAMTGEEVAVRVRVLGPHWTATERVELFANGLKIREAMIDSREPGPSPGVKAVVSWTLPKPRHDVHIVAVARGPGIQANYWRSAKPYQPTTPRWEPYVLGVSGAVWLDADGDGKRTTARQYAERLHAKAGGDLAKLVASLAGYDEAVAAHAAFLVDRGGHPPTDPAVPAALDDAAPAVRAGFRSYLEAWRENEAGRAAGR